MNRPIISNIFKICVIVSGIFCFLFAILNINVDNVTSNVLLLSVFTVSATPLLSLKLPRSNFTVSFSDSLIFLAFLLFGGEIAIVLATLEMTVNCFYLKSKGLKFGFLAIPFNIFNISFSTGITFLVWSLIHKTLVVNIESPNIHNLITNLVVLATMQFLATSIFAAIFHSLSQNKSLWFTWKKECFSSLMTQIIGAGLAGITFLLISADDLFIMAMAFCVFVAAYIYYRQSISEIDKAINKAEQFEREKANAERLRAEQAESHIGELNILLEKEEQINEALRQSKVDLEYAAYHDYLTELPNRLYLIERLGFLLEIGIDISHKYFVVFMDLSHFKYINDSLGHTIGDKILKIISNRLVTFLREEDTVARLGGDEFAIILNDLASIDEAKNLTQQLSENLSQPYQLDGNLIFTEINFGIAPFDSEHKKPEDILRDANIAMHYAKEKESGIEVFNKELRTNYLDKISLENELRFAIERQELSMHFQPIISLNDGELFGFEALLRWQNQKRGFISPAHFIPIAEESGLIIPITKWILLETTAQLAEWQKINNFENLIVSINISGKHLADLNLVSDVNEAIVLSKLDPATLKLEITESAAMENAKQSIEILTQLKKLGVQLSIDDFGTGYSSLAYLHRLPFDTIKIDRSFINEITETGENGEILQTIMSLANNLRMKVIAEGIETEAQLSYLQHLGCQYGQGYLMSKPLPKPEIEQLLYSKRHWLTSPEPNTKLSKTEAVKTDGIHIF